MDKDEISRIRIERTPAMARKKTSPKTPDEDHHDEGRCTHLTSIFVDTDTLASAYPAAKDENGEADKGALTASPLNPSVDRGPRKALLLGAGFSYDFGMPLVADVSRLLLEPFTVRGAERAASVLSKRQPYTADRPISAEGIRKSLQLVVEARDRGETDYEAVLAEIQDTRHLATQPERDSFHYVEAFLYEAIYSILALYQLISYDVCYRPTFDSYAPVRDVLNQGGPTWIFSLNHDLVLECLLLDLRLPLSYGSDGSLSFPVDNSAARSEIVEFQT